MKYSWLFEKLQQKEREIIFNKRKYHQGSELFSLILKRSYKQFFSFNCANECTKEFFFVKFRTCAYFD